MQKCVQKLLLIIGCYFIFSTASIAQDSTSADGLFQMARTAAFTQKDYNTAKQYLNRAITKSPGYADLWIFLGRIYSWTDHYDSARYCFDSALHIQPEYEDASVAYADVEYWNDHYDKALAICNKGLQYHPSSEELLLRKAKVLNALQQYENAETTIQKLISINRNNTAARALANSIRESASKNKIDVSYDFVYFDKQFSDPWHLVSVDYGRTTPIGVVTGRINYANRFAQNAVQYEAEAYPHISKTFYSYVNVAYCDNNNGVFPQWRGGFSLYANLPKSYEGELGVRYLLFSGTPTWVYTAYVGKYYKSWLFGARTYVTPSTYVNTPSASYNVIANYYYGSADDVIAFSAGYGISPDDRYNAIQIFTAKLKTYKAGITFRKKVSKMNVLSADANWLNQEYLPDTKGNQYQIGLAWLHRF